MKYYGFKFRSSSPETTVINRNVGTWIGLIGSLLFLISAAESGGFKGRIGAELLYTIAYPAVLWFLSLLGTQYRWPAKALVIISGIAILIAAGLNLYIMITKERVLASLLCFLILNIGIFVLAKKPDSSGLESKI